MSTVIIKIVGGQIHLSPDLLAMMAEFGVEAELTSPEVLTRAFLAAIFYKTKKENFHCLESLHALGWKDAHYSIHVPGQRGGEWVTWVYTIQEGRISLKPKVEATLIESGVNRRLISPEALSKVFAGLRMHTVRKVKLVSSNVARQPEPGNPGK
ncbi:hypothetical protein CRENBAI_016425 [Crenichthys baileyi]|uniref:Uncharacterized protein n=1 Tax=Crenichthys baileyi TaxID=28760 RepID=A0AAV9QS66_9TELE